MRKASVIIALGTLGLCTLCLAAQEAVPGAKNVGEFLAMGQVAAATSRVQYCVNAVPPPLRNELQAELVTYRAKFNIAIRPTLDRIARSALLSGPIPPGLAEAFEARSHEGLETIKKIDPQIACSNLLGALKLTTLESIRALSEESLRRYEVMMSPNPPSPH